MATCASLTRAARIICFPLTASSRSKYPRPLVDAQRPPSLARWIASQGHEAIHVFDIAMHTAGDAAVCAYAATEDRILITKDEDFVDRWLLSEGPRFRRRLPTEALRAKVGLLASE
jgi:uncharacterized protein DUF5615